MRIAVTVDGTSASSAVLQRAVATARESGASLVGVFVIDAGWADFIGNDWQSSRNARQGFLDYVREEQHRYADAARAQFDAATGDLPDARFLLLAGEPAEEVVHLMANGGADMLFTASDVFKACGRPSVKSLARTLRRRVRQPVHLV